EHNISKVINDIRKVMTSANYTYKILIVDDGSTDKTVELAKKEGAIVYSHPKNYGLAETFKTEMERCLKSNADIIVHTDADNQYKAEDILRLIKEIEKGNDLVLGSRFMGHIESMSLIKKLGNKAFSRVVSKITKTKITDAQTGFRAFTKDVAKNIKIISNFTYTQEQIIKAIKQKYRIKEIPIDTRKTRKSKLMKNPLDFATKAGTNLFRIYRDYEPLKFFGTIGGIFIITGLLIGTWLLYLFLTTGRMGRTPSAILSMLLIVVGAQITSFGFLADMNRK
ncbi:MAG: glycosyltransferase, partial [Candidatus Woesearchaeota archaeon]|nr:glycosyltransferase [Candidatus Woesearchaeota archaeon]